jgi:hypothetical protein
MTLRALVLWFAATPLLAAAGTSANYTLAVGTFDGGGGKGVTAAARNLLSGCGPLKEPVAGPAGGEKGVASLPF